MKTKLLFLLFIFTHICVESYSQSYRSINYTVNNGLPSSELYHVIQDSKGYIWFGTNQGVSRYDGYRFENFDLTDGLPDNTVFEIYEDYCGRIWFIPLTGMLSYYQDGKIHQYRHNNLIKEYLDNGMYPVKMSFIVDLSDNVYLSLYGKRSIKISKNGSIERIIPKNNSECARLIQVLPGGQLLYDRHYMSQEIAVSCFGEEFLISHEMKYGLPVRTMAATCGSMIYYADGKDLLIIDYESREYCIHKFDKELIWVSIDKLGNLWIGFLNGGMVGYSNSDIKNEQYRLFENNSVSSVACDSEGGYWVTTLDKGAYYLPNIKIEALTNNDGLGLEKVSKLDKNNGSIWFGGDHCDLYSFDLNRVKSYQYFDIEDAVYKAIDWLGDSLFISISPADPGGYLIYNNLKTEIYPYFVGAYRTKDNTTYLHSKTLLKYQNGIIKSIFQDKWSIIYYLDICEKPGGGFWVGTEDGLYLFDDDNFIRMGDDNLLFSSRIQCIDYLGKDLWLGTKGKGLVCVSRDSTYSVTIKHGIPSNSINAMTVDGDTLWIGTNKGVGKLYYSGNNLKVEKWTISNGLINNEINDLCIERDHIFAGTNGGLCYFRKGLNGINNRPPPVYLNGIKIMGKDRPIKKGLKLDYSLNHIVFKYIGLSYQRTQPLKYRYRLLGLEDEWKTTEQLSVQYPFLPPGKYKFEVMAVNNSGVSSNKVSELTFEIQEPYWRNIWFRMIIIGGSVLVMFAIMILLFQIRLKAYKRRTYLEKEMNRFRQRALSSQMNPHFLYNTLNSVQSYILKNESYMASEYLSRLGALLRRILLNSQFETISLKEEVEAMKLYVDLELSRFKNSFCFTVDISEEVDLNEIKVPPLIIQPYVENAIHHGLRSKEGEKKLIVEVLPFNGFIKITIEDNGVGRNNSSPKGVIRGNKTSLGTDITSRRLLLYEEIHNQFAKVSTIDLMNDFGVPCGTRVIILLKQKYKY